MGWGGGTEIFDTVAESVLDEDGMKPEIDVDELLTNLFNVLRDHDWDVVNESSYYEHPTVREVIEEIEPDWFEDDED